MTEWREQRIEEKGEHSGSDCGTQSEIGPKRVHRISLESDSLPECSATSSTRRKKKYVRKPKPVMMDVDSVPKANTLKSESQMEVDGFESQLSSSDSDDKQGDCEADDEQSDWVGYSNSDGDHFDPSDRRTRRLNPKVQLSQLQRRLERFALSGSKGEMGLEFKIKDRPNSAQFHRMLMQYRLEVVERQRGNVVLRKKNNCASVAECE